ncbi:LppU/SCO3897 family protein [Actinokineospora bangkokensis]|uniref:Uncharacterized protein n=1 Tax=Actinokineospora bangkokensis TaxID=1193682 RepID=A0A1Q9LCU2_9PSEU|nr:hypothetical protein [Actinokineospora bangkokensis]OLR89851.1 hypothetical protein BJP25_02190 [Actinokineospora bangkokensis]
MADEGERPARKRLPGWAVAASTAAVFVVAFLLMRLFSVGEPSLAAGGCAAVSGAAADAELTALDCDDDGASFTVVSTGGAPGCPDGVYRELTSAGQHYCLMPNFKAGRCYAPDDENRSLVLSDCAADDAFRVTEVRQGATDAGACPGGNGLDYREPPVVFCVQAP